MTGRAKTSFAGDKSCGQVELHHWHCGTGIWPRRDIVAGRRRIASLYFVSADRGISHGSHTRAKSRGSRPRRAISRERRTVRWRKMDSNFQFRKEQMASASVIWVAQAGQNRDLGRVTAGTGECRLKGEGRDERDASTQAAAGGKWIQTSGSGASGEAGAFLPVKDRPR